MSRSFPLHLRFLLLVLAATLSACSDDGADNPNGDLPVIKVGEVPLKMELALTRSEQSQGLMHREGIAADQGMLFVFTEPQAMSFWMKNVSFPIDIGYFTSDGVLREVYRLHAHDTQSRRSKRDDLLYALEVEAGWFNRNEVRPGARLDLEALQAALAKRRS